MRLLKRRFKKSFSARVAFSAPSLHVTKAPTRGRGPSASTSAHALWGAVCIGSFTMLAVVLPVVLSTHYTKYAEEASAGEENKSVEAPAPQVLHLATPDAVRAIYMTQCVAGTPDFRERLVRLIEETEINSIVIDIKDYTGMLGFIPRDELLAASRSTRCYAPDLAEFLTTLHEKGIYTIARITVFQDPFMAERKPHLAVKKASAKEEIWADYKGLHFIDVGAREYWDYIVTLSREAYAIGFDELNYDYIRFPSDGNMKDIYFPHSEEQILGDGALGKAKVLRSFFEYLHSSLEDTGAVLSADLFGMTTTNPDDLNIGQILEYALPYFDYIAPMVYPSHYPKGFRGYQNPAAAPYEIVHFSMARAVAKVDAYVESASTTPAVRGGRISRLQLRPWLQDFDLGATYTPEMVRAQMQAVYDAGLTSWMLWDPANTYTREALRAAPEAGATGSAPAL